MRCSKPRPRAHKTRALPTELIDHNIIIIIYLYIYFKIFFNQSMPIFNPILLHNYKKIVHL